MTLAYPRVLAIQTNYALALVLLNADLTKFCAKDKQIAILVVLNLTNVYPKFKIAMVIIVQMTPRLTVVPSHVVTMIFYALLKQMLLDVRRRNSVHLDQRITKKVIHF